ncbi:response regulator [Rhizorhabdus argentea]|uniref:response regulator n=1 Tax=Rhizorhabdus argentea TaxID=1387174 RepID=UPI0030EF0F23
MTEAHCSAISGYRLLLVEDDYFIASDVALWLESNGASVLGPVGSVGEALDALAENPAGVDVAVLDINLGKERVFPVADALATADLPFLFLTGYDKEAIPEGYRHVPRCPKPLDRDLLIRMIAAALKG